MSKWTKKSAHLWASRYYFIHSYHLRALPAQLHAYVTLCISPLQVKISETLPTQCLVLGVSPSSPSEQAGVKSDDLILKIAEQEVRLLPKQEVEELLEQAAAKACIYMTLRRPQAAPTANGTETESAVGKEDLMTVTSPAPTATPSPPSQRAQPAVSVMNYITGDKLNDTLISRTSKVRDTFQERGPNTKSTHR